MLTALAIAQLCLFGRLSSYPDGTAEFGLNWLWERPIHARSVPAPYRNSEFYPQLLLGRWNWLVPGLPILAGIELWHRRVERAARFAIGVMVINLVTYLAYFYQDRRFLLPTAVLLVVLSGSAVGRLAGHARAEVGTENSPRQYLGLVRRRPNRVTSSRWFHVAAALDRRS